jgi:broad specificity phosphatase PhoE
MTVVLLVRHGLCNPVGRSIAGRAPGVKLNGDGERQVEALSRALAAVTLDAIYTSPLERTRETAEALARGRQTRVLDCEGLTEIDFGDWTGRTLAELDELPLWRAFNQRRGTTRIPGGESMADVVDRGRRVLHRIERSHGPGVVAAVTHGDVIRALIADCIGLPLDRMLGFEVAPASVSTLEVGRGYFRVLGINWRVEGPL